MSGSAAPRRTQVGIVGGGPAGLLLARLLRRQGIDTVVLERHTRAYVESRIRAGVLEQGTVDVLRDAAVSENIEREAIPHSGFSVAFDDRLERIDMRESAGNRSIRIYGQTALTCDLYRALLDEDEANIIFEAEDVTPAGFLDGTPSLSYRVDGVVAELRCDFIVGCDGYYGASRQSVPQEMIREFERVYPFQWLGILADSTPVDDELIYSADSRGFALYSMRPGGQSRNYIQCGAEDRLTDWSRMRYGTSCGNVSRMSAPPL